MSEEGLNKSAILLLSLGENEAAEVFKYLNPKEVQKLGTAMASKMAATVSVTINSINVKPRACLYRRARCASALPGLSSFGVFVFITAVLFREPIEPRPRRVAKWLGHERLI